MAKTVTSPDISVLDFSVRLDISTAVPTVRITNLSTGLTDANLQWVFDLQAPSTYYIHKGSFDAPEIDATAFTTFVFSESVPLSLKQVEFSKLNQYIVTVSVKDSNGDIFTLSKGQSICKPSGNTNKNNFGAALISIESKCSMGLLLVTDKTNLLYKGVVGSQVETTVKLDYPTDEQGDKPAQFTTTILPCMIPIYTDGEGYNIYVAHVFDYDLGDGFVVRVRYSFNDTFNIACNVNLQPLLCEVGRVADILRRSCNEDTADNRLKRNSLALATVYLQEAVLGIVQPLSGVDVVSKVEKVKEIMGVECDCCLPAGISNIGVALLTDAVLSVNKICGDSLLSWTNDGMGNITLNYQSATYTLVISEREGNSAAFVIDPVISTGCNKATPIFVDLEILSTEILTEITNNPTLLDILNGITQRAQLSCTGLDGGEAINFDACDYRAVISAAISGATFVSVLIDGVIYTAPTGTLLNDAAAISSFLNSLDAGVFVVSYDSGTFNTTITSAANEHAVSTATTLSGGATKITAFINNCDLICTILQRILTYMNEINLLQVKAGVGLTICRFNTDGTVNTKVFDEDVPASTIASYLADSFCNVVNYTKDKLLTCANIKTLFAAFTGTTGDPSGADIVYMGMSGECQQVPLKNVAISILKQIISDTDVKAQFCAIPPCASVATCAAVTGLTEGVGSDTTKEYSWTGVAGATGYKWSKDGVNYNLVTSTAAFLTGLTANTAYTFRVYPVYPFGDGTSCEVTDGFVTTNSGAICDAPDNLVLDTVLDTSFRATWDAVTGASGYQYRINGGSWVSIGLVLTVTPTGLTPDTVYNFDVRAIIGATPCSEMASDSVTTDVSSTSNVFIGNSAADLSVSSATISGSPFFVTTFGSFPLETGDNLIGEQSGVSGVITINTTGSFSNAHADLVVAGVFIECIDLASGGAHSFTVRSYLSTESIEISVGDGTCGA